MARMRIRLADEALFGAALPDLERLAAWLGCAPTRKASVTDATWKAAVVRAIQRREKAIAREPERVLDVEDEDVEPWGCVGELCHCAPAEVEVCGCELRYTRGPVTSCAICGASMMRAAVGQT